MTLDGYTTDQLKTMHSQHCDEAMRLFVACKQITKANGEIALEDDAAYAIGRARWEATFAAADEQYGLAIAIAAELDKRAHVDA